MIAKVERENTITLICPNLSCGKMIAAPISARGKSVRCAHCNTPFRVPAAPVTVLDDPDAPPGKKKTGR